MSFSRWHRRMMAMLGVAHFFDAFDATAMAFVLPVLVVLWSLSPNETGLLIAAGYGGQMVGAVVLGSLAERFGRISVLQWALGLLAGMSIACALASGYTMLLALRFIQGIGLGGEMPIVATYVSEVTPTRFRGRMVGLFQFIFGVGSMVASAAALLLIPYFGWRALFVVGAAPLILVVLLRRVLPESPRWLVARGRAAEAEAAISVIEDAVDPGSRPAEPDVVDRVEVQSASGRSNLRALLTPPLLRRTLSAWLMAFCSSLIGYGIVSWMPTLYTTTYGLSLKTALLYGFVTGAFSLLAAVAAIFLIDRIGRKGSFLLSFAGASGMALIMALTAYAAPPVQIMLLASLTVSFIGLSMVGMYVYCPEIYPALLRAFGTGVASAWVRVGAVVGPMVIGLLMTIGDIRWVFIFFSATAAVGGVCVLLLVNETKGVALDMRATEEQFR